MAQLRSPQSEVAELVWPPQEEARRCTEQGAQRLVLTLTLTLTLILALTH